MAYGSVSYGIISEQPRSRPLGYDATHYNGEQIIFEANCDAHHLKKEIWKSVCCAPVPRNTISLLLTLKGFVVWILVSPIYWIFCSGPLGCVCSRRVANSWRLLLTPSRIYYTHKHQCCLCRSTDTNIQVNLNDIGKMYVQNNKVPTGCFSTSTVPTTVVIELKHGHRLDLLSRQQRRTNSTFVKLYFTHCANAEHFTQAVEHQMQSIQTFG